MNTHKRYPKELKDRAVRMVLEHSAEHQSEWQAIISVAAKSSRPFVANHVVNSVVKKSQINLKLVSLVKMKANK